MIRNQVIKMLLSVMQYFIKVLIQMQSHSKYHLLMKNRKLWLRLYGNTMIDFIIYFKMVIFTKK